MEILKEAKNMLPQFLREKYLLIILHYQTRLRFRPRLK